jgi:DNA-binding beta-propeller fold protein YncE
LPSFQAADLLARSRRVGYAVFAIGTSPVGLAVRPDGKQVWVALSHRFGNKGLGQLAGVALEASASSVKRMSAPAAGFPREIAFLHDGRTLVATLFAAQRVEFMPTPP